MHESSASDQPQFFPDSLLGEIRKRFAYVDRDPLNGRRIYLENAGGSLTLRSAVGVASEVSSLPDNAGRSNKSSQYIEWVLRKGLDDVRLLLGLSDQEQDDGGVVFSTESSTASAFRVLDAVTDGHTFGNLVCTNLDHPCTYDATRYFAEERGLDWRVAALDPKTCTVPIDSVATLVDQQTLAVTLIHSSNVTGSRLDVDAMAAVIRKKAPRAMVIVDGTQRASHGPLDLPSMDADVYWFSPYKAFSTVGLCFCYVGPRVCQLRHPRIRGKFADHWDLGTRDAGGYAAWSAVVDYLCWLGEQCGGGDDRARQLRVGLRAAENHEFAISQRVLEGNDDRPGLLEMPGITLYGIPETSPQRDPVFAFNVEGRNARDVVGVLGEEGIVTHDRQSDAFSGHTLGALGIDSCVRASFSHYNSVFEVDEFLNELSKLAHG